MRMSAPIGHVRLSAFTVVLCLGILFQTVPSESLAQASAADRYRWIDPERTATSDDPRRLPIPTQKAPRDDVIVIRSGLIFDGTGAAARPGSLVIRGRHIEKIVDAGAQVPSNAVVIEAAGKTVLPGLIDLHTHLSHPFPGQSSSRAWDLADATLRGVERLRYYIESGITSIRDATSIGGISIRLKEAVAANRIVGPRVFAAGRGIAATGGHGREGQGAREVASGEAANGPDQWRAAVRRQFDDGADVIKLFSHFTAEEVKAAVDEAHELGLRVMVDAETFYIERAVRAGADVIEHPLPRTDETIRMMAKQGTYAVPTLVPYIYLFATHGGYWNSPSRRFTFDRAANLDVVRRMHRAGIKMGVGTDLSGDWFRMLPGPYITELKELVAAGLSTTEALQAATRIGAEILGMSDKLGTLGAGKLADVLIVEGAPARNLDDLARVDTVIRDGLVVVRNGQLVIPRHIAAPEPVEDNQ